MNMLENLEGQLNRKEEQTLLEKKAYIDGFFDGNAYAGGPLTSKTEKVEIENKLLFET